MGRGCGGRTRLLVLALRLWRRPRRVRVRRPAAAIPRGRVDKQRARPFRPAAVGGTPDQDGRGWGGLGWHGGQGAVGADGGDYGRALSCGSCSGGH